MFLKFHDFSCKLKIERERVHIYAQIFTPFHGISNSACARFVHAGVTVKTHVMASFNKLPSGNGVPRFAVADSMFRAAFV
jgi:hypothetical protein